MPANDPIQQPGRDHLAYHVVESLRRFGLSLGEAEFADRLVRALLDVRAELHELGALPRQDAAVHGPTHEHAVILKLSERARWRLDRDPGDRTARWALIAVSLAWRTNDAGLPLIAVDIAADTRAVAYAVAAARWVWTQTGADPCPYLRQALDGIDRAELTRLAERPAGDRDGDPARIALRILAGQGADLL